MQEYNFRNARKKLGISQAKMAEAFGVAACTVWRWEHGRCPVPKWVPLALIGLDQRLKAAGRAKLSRQKEKALKALEAARAESLRVSPPPERLFW